jgi:pullulanase
MDETVPEGHRGKFMAFTCDGSAGTAHLRGLAEAGMTHVHLLPLYDFGSVDERPENWRYPDGDLSHFEPDSTEQQV